MNSAVLGITIAFLVSLCRERFLLGLLHWYCLEALGSAGSESCSAEGAVQPLELASCLCCPAMGYRSFWFYGLTCAMLAFSTVTWKC